MHGRFDACQVWRMIRWMCVKVGAVIRVVHDKFGAWRVVCDKFGARQV